MTRVVLGSQGWSLPRTSNAEWVQVGRRRGGALVAEQDPYDEAAALAHGISTWLDTPEETARRNPALVVGARHFKVPLSFNDHAAQKFFTEALGFKLFPKRWLPLEPNARPAGERVEVGV